MKREELIVQVKNEYARLADISGKENYIDHTEINETDELYYEILLQRVLNAIQEGRFDGYSSGRDVVEAVANDKLKIYG